MYIGLAKNFKNRYRQHKKSMSDRRKEGATTLSTYFWQQKDLGTDPTVSWKILEKNIPTFNRINNTCRLCLREKFNIVINSTLATLNARNEIFSHCRHMRSKLIGRPPDCKVKVTLISFWISFCISHLTLALSEDWCTSCITMKL